MHRNPTKCWDNYQLAAFSSCSASGFFEGLIQALLKHDRQQVFQHCHALGVALCTHRKPVQLALRSQPSSGSPPRPCLSHAGSAATTHTSDKRRSHTYPLPETDQTSERTQIRLCHPPQLHPPAYAVSLHYRSPYPQVLSPLSAPYSQVCPHLIKRRNRRAAASHAYCLIATLKTASDARSPVPPFLTHLLIVGTLAPTTHAVADKFTPHRASFTARSFC